MHGWTSFITLCLSSILLSSTLAQDRVCNEEPTNFHMCGNELSDTVQLVCSALGGLFQFDKRDTYHRSTRLGKFQSMVYGNADTSKVIEEVKQRLDNAKNTAQKRAEKHRNINKLQQFMLNKRQAFSYAGGVEPGIVCECCYNSCEWVELTQYCNYLY